MTHANSRFEEIITQLRRILPTNTATAQAIDQHEPWERIATKAIEDGYVESTDEFVLFVEACVRSNT